MPVSLPHYRSGRRLISPALLGAVAVCCIAFATLAQGQPTGGGAGGAATQPAAAAASVTTAPAPVPQTMPSSLGDPSGQGGVTLLWDLFRKGGTVMWILAACSVLAVAIIFERMYALRRGRIIPRGFMRGLRSIYRDPLADRERGLAYCDAKDSPMARMVAAFVRRLPRGYATAEKALEDAGGNEALKLRTNLRLLYAIGSVATLLGLLGTIAGMIKAFMRTADPRAGEGMDRVKLLSEGIYEAMVCTFGGLAVAILVTAFYYYFVGKVEKLVGQINDELTVFADDFGPRAESADELSTTAALPQRIR